MRCRKGRLHGEGQCQSPLLREQEEQTGQKRLTLPIPPPELSGHGMPGIEIDRLPANELLDLRRAADEMMAVLEEAGSQGRHILTDVLNSGSGPFTEWTHYPPGDVQDPDTGALWYFHAHSGDRQDGSWPECGHFHLFLYSEHLPRDAAPIALPDDANAELGGLCHLVAISFAASGVPTRIFATNRWVTDEWLYPAEIIIPLLDRFEIDSDRFGLTTRWLAAALRLFRPQVEWSLLERDRALARLRQQDPLRFSEDREHEILVSVPFDLNGQIDTVEKALALTRPG